MIRHIVLAKIRSDVPAQEVTRIFRGIVAVGERLGGIRSVDFGPSDSPENLERGYTWGLTVDFDDREALRVYAEDAGHRAVGAQIVGASEGGAEGLLVVDLELE